jgi:hypothetical protein
LFLTLCIVRFHTCKKGDETPGTPYFTLGCYNCLAWCIGTDVWRWDEASPIGDGAHILPSEMTAYLASQGVPSGTIAYYSAGGFVQHVAKKGGGPGNNCKATSKTGKLALIDHDLNELEGGYYGNLVGGN